MRIPALPDLPPPRKARVKTYGAMLQHGLVWISLGEPAQAPPPFPEWQAEDFRKLPCGPYAVAASGPRIVENFLDVAHVPFVHENILGTPDRPEIADHQAVIGDARVEATGVRVWQPDPHGAGEAPAPAQTKVTVLVRADGWQRRQPWPAPASEANPDATVHRPRR